jgi:bifunctional non-homologous end joining protein LigD
MHAVMTPPSAEHITLYYRQGSSDKEYQASIEPEGEGFVVNFAYGRRGTTLQTGTKTNRPVDYQTAKRVYDKLVQEKTGKGYTPEADGTPYRHSEKEDRTTGLLPQLLNPVAETEVQRLIQDPHFCSQEKLDGRRMLIKKEGAAINGINRTGLMVGLPESIFQSVRSIPGDLVLDGEAIGETFFAFDVLQYGITDLCDSPYKDRLVCLLNLLASVMQRHVIMAETAFDTANKRIMLRDLKKQGREGIVFKRIDAPYTPGRPNSGGSQLKCKFYATASCVVAKINGTKRSVELRLLNGNGWNQVGNVTIPPNFQVPSIGKVVEVRYLYAFKGSNALYQPVFLGPRTDVGQHECVLSQLKYKPTGEEDEC